MGKMKNFNLQLFGESEDAAFDIIQEIKEDYMYVETEDAIKIMHLAQLKRTADALEEIASTLDKIGNSVELLEKLADCVDEPVPYVGGSQFCVKGNINRERRK